MSPPPFLGPPRSQGLQLSSSHFHSRDGQAVHFCFISLQTHLACTGAYMLCKISRMAEISVFEQTKIVPQSKLRISTGNVKFTDYLELLHDCEFLPVVVSLPAMALYSLGNQGNQGAAEFMALGHHCHPSSLCSQLSEKMPPIAKEYNAAGRTDLLCTKFLASQVVLNGNSSCNLLSMIVFTVKILPGPFALPIWFQFLI